eukprot:TRINITY_DN2372_c0_g1_i2.p1 TRINITY_DN2372_c0_g1~~TRINITY_DN2372_c0_g1_i2.p1  ORF type:complete len:500 (+),score=165.67 TRINITY_DN2372_c0_g1_i2:183-1682(+)
MAFRRAAFAGGPTRKGMPNVVNGKLLPMSVRGRGISAQPLKSHPWGNVGCNYAFDNGSLPNGKTIEGETVRGIPVSEDVDVARNFTLGSAALDSADPRRSTMYDELLRKGAEMGSVHNGFSSMLRAMYFPRDGEDKAAAVEREYWACRNGAAVWDMSSFVKLRVEGPDAAAELERLCSLKVDRPVEEQRLVYCCLCNDDGGVAADITVLRESKQSFYIVVGAELLRQVVTFLRLNVRPDADLTVRDVSGLVGVLHVAGPKSRAVLQAAAPQAQLDSGYQPFGTARTITLGGDPCLGGNGVRVRACRISFMGDLGWELHCAMEDLPVVYKHVMDAGKDHGVTDAGYACIGALRTERMFLHWGPEFKKGVDLTSSEIPSELGMVIKKAPFQGRDAIIARKKLMQKRLISVVIDDSEARLSGMEELRRNGERCGFVATGSHSYSLGSAVGIGWVQRPDCVAEWSWVLDEAAQYSVVCGDGREVACKVLRKAAFDPDGERMRA